MAHLLLFGLTAVGCGVYRALRELDKAARLPRRAAHVYELPEPDERLPHGDELMALGFGFGRKRGERERDKRLRAPRAPQSANTPGSIVRARSSRLSTVQGL